MKIEISEVRNGLLVDIKFGPTANDPLAQRANSGVWFALDAQDAIARISEALQGEYRRAPDLESAS